MRIIPIFFVISLTIFSDSLQAQQIKNSHALVYVDDQGVLRWTKDKGEASFFGVNYTVPFAYSYRAHKALGVDIEQAIRQDVYHLARLGLDAFRVHVWDTEISDSLGNLLDNDHLRLFDFLLSELAKRDIRAIITPIAFWGNGYPEADERTPGFSRVFGKGRATSNDTAIRAQENYLRQLFKHVNSYTKLTYTDDPNVVAVELNNEPSHSGPKSGVTAYINRLAAAVKSDGWAKPLFYNISQSPYYADAVAASVVNGFSFQWYPSGLVAGHEQKGNFLPNVDRYTIPYDTIPAFVHRARMVYEFESADVIQSYMYPAMARSFRAAGFQWATQFAYDPLVLAYANTEYQTHYLNLAYTPSKAISILIASRVFHKMPRGAGDGSRGGSRAGLGAGSRVSALGGERASGGAGYPADSTFGDFRVSYRNSLSEMNSGQEFYYTNTTETKPVDLARLRHIAGVGSSPVVRYAGSGAYFLDRVGEGMWRLEVMPDAVTLRDPFGRPAPDREVVRVQWDREAMRIMLPDLGEGFAIKGLNTGNDYKTVAAEAGFFISPGTYLVSAAGKGADVKGTGAKTAGSGREGTEAGTIGVLGMDEFVAPKPFSNEPFVVHEPCEEVSSGKPVTIRAEIVGIDSADQVMLQVSRGGGGFGGGGRMSGINMTRENPTTYSGEIAAGSVTPGLLEYRIIIHRVGGGNGGGGSAAGAGSAGGEWIVFPGDHKGNPFTWDYVNTDHWQTVVEAANNPLEIFDPAIDKDVNIYPSFGRGFQAALMPGPDPGRLVMRLAGRGDAGAGGGGRRRNLSEDHLLGFQYFFADKLKGRAGEHFDKLFIRARSGGEGPVRAKITLTDADARSFSTDATVGTGYGDIEVSLDSMVEDSVLMLPRPYPGFLPLWFKAAGGAGSGGGATNRMPGLAVMERIQITLDAAAASLEIGSIWVGNNQTVHQSVIK
ncbi:MAG TPA: membrane or secreted protein [Puia sp.]|jgi:hypothetical protein